MFLTHKNIAFDYYLPLSHPCANLIQSCVENAKKIFTAKEFGYEFAVHTQVINIFISLTRFSNYSDLSAKQLLKKKSANTDITFNKALEYIETHLNEELTLEKISAVAGLSPNYFSNIFRKQTGLKLWDFISEKRVTLATKLLSENPNVSVITIALKCGYNNCPNFNRAFKKYTGMTPKKYKSSVIRQESFNEKQ
jgi:AraC-like DNA-binding protein